jgi:hypothetical protein
MPNDNATIQLQLRKRQSQLESSATAQKSTISFAKTVGLAGGVGAAWMLAISNPAVAAAAAIVGAANYYASTTAETKKVGEFRPLLGRKSLSALAMGLDRRTVILDPIASIEDDVLYLGDDELGEWILLSSARAETAQFLAQFPPDKWDEAIELAARECYRTYGYLFRQDAEARARMRHERVGLHTLSAVKGEAQCLLADAAIAPVPAIGAATQLGAIPVQAVGVGVEVAIAPPETYPMANTEVSPDDRRALIARLKEECPALLKLAKSHPIRAVGVQRAGKSTLVKLLTLLRMVLIPGHRVVACTPHYEPENSYPNVFKIAGIAKGGQRDYPAIEREWSAMAAGVESCQKANRTYIFDEFGLFDKVMDEETIKTVLTSSLRESMKFETFPIFILHGETAAFMPGSKGLVTVMLGSTVRLEAIGEPVEDDMGLETIRPTGKFTVTWLNGTRDEGTVPAWLTEQYLLGLIGNSAPIPAAPIPCPEPDHANRTEKPKAAISVPNPVDSTPELIESDDTIEQQIADFIKAYPPGNGGLKMRELKRKFKRVEPKKVEGIAFTLSRCYPGKFRINREMINGGESIKIEAI